LARRAELSAFIEADTYVVQKKVITFGSN